MGKLAELSLQYFRNTPSEQLKADWEELRKYNDAGPDMLAVLSNYGELWDTEVYYSSLSNNYSIASVSVESLSGEYEDDNYCLAA